MEDTNKKSKLQQLLHDLGKQIDDLVDKAKETKDDAKEELHDMIEELKKKRDAVEEEFKKMRESDRWTETGKHLENSATEFVKAIEALFSRSK